MDHATFYLLLQRSNAVGGRIRNEQHLHSITTKRSLKFFGYKLYVSRRLQTNCVLRGWIFITSIHSNTRSFHDDLIQRVSFIKVKTSVRNEIKIDCKLVCNFCPTQSSDALFIRTLINGPSPNFYDFLSSFQSDQRLRSIIWNEINQ